jgi:photosystem II stability/assembly factor-like uncharacterized protein
LKIRSFKNTRNFHKWIGLVCSVFFIILSLSGFILMHYESFGLNNVVVSGRFLPDKYFQVAISKRNIHSIAATPDGSIYVGTDHGLFRSNDSGKSWVELEQGLFHKNIRTLAVDPVESNIIYAGTPGGIFKTEDGGDHWTDWFDASSGLENSEVNDIVIHPEENYKIFAATQGGLYFSDDAGDSWQIIFGAGEREKDIPVNLIRLSALDPGTMYIGTTKEFYRSMDSGKTWESVWENRFANAVSLVSVKTDPEFFYLGTEAGLFKSFNQGRTWVKDDNNDIRHVSSLIVNPNNIAELTISAGGKILLSQDGGDSWKPLEFDPPGDLFSSKEPSFTQIQQIYSPSPLIFAGTTAGLFLTSDSGKHWSEQELSGVTNQPVERKMDLVKLFTEIHTGRFFGSYFVLLVDLATLGLILLVISGVWVGKARNKIKREKKERLNGEMETDLLINVQETADDLSVETNEIHDMIEHIGNHLEKCKSIYMSKEKKEIEEIDRHITTLDKKMHNLMRRIDEFEKFSQN